MGYESSLNNNSGFIDRFRNFLGSLSNYTDVTLTIPSEIFYRTELMCECIESELDLSWQLTDFIMLLYSNFIKDSVENYNPKKVLMLFKSRPQYTDETVFEAYGERFTYNKYRSKTTTIEISMAKDEVSKGQLILNEIYELYGYEISFDMLLSYLWIDYIDEYKKGNNKKAYKALYKLLKDSI